MTSFKFINSVTIVKIYKIDVATTWRAPIIGRPVYVMWKKLHRLQPIITTINKPLAETNCKLKKTRGYLMEAQKKAYVGQKKYSYYHGC